MKAARIRDLMARVERDRRKLGLYHEDLRGGHPIVQPGLKAGQHRRLVAKVLNNEREIERLLLEGVNH